MRLVHNQAGANMAGGVATTLLDAAAGSGGIDGELGLFEVDELWLAAVAAQLHPRAIALCNLFRDQLDRYGELDRIAASWQEVAGRAPARAWSSTPTIRCSRTSVASTPDAIYFGVDDDTLALPGMAHAADAKHCRRCGAPYMLRRRLPRPPRPLPLRRAAGSAARSRP